MNKKLNTQHILIHSTFQMMAAIVYGFGIFMLMERGYDSAQAGLCLSIANIICIVLSPFVSNFLDTSKKYSIFEAVPFIGIFVLIFYIINFFCKTKTIILSLAFVIGNGLYALMEPMVNSYSSTFQNNGVKIGFSFARAAGSFSYGIMCAIFGVLSVKYSYSSVVIGGIIFSLAFLLVTYNTRRTYYQTNTNVEVIEDLEGISFKEFIKNNKLFLALCVFLTGLFLGYTSVDNFMLLVTENVGGNSSDMGIILAFKALIEALSIALFPVLVKKIKLENLLIVSAIAFVIKALAIYLAPSVLFIYVAQLFQSASFGFVFPGMVEFIYRKMDKKEAIRGNACFTMTIGIGSMLSSALGGFICNLYGTSNMELVAFIISFVSCVGFVAIINIFKKLNKSST